MFSNAEEIVSCAFCDRGKEATKSLVLSPAAAAAAETEAVRSDTVKAPVRGKRSGAMTMHDSTCIFMVSCDESAVG